MKHTLQGRQKMRQPKEVILDALNNYHGDDLERAEIAFKNFSTQQLNEQYGQSGKTCRQILEGYRKHSAEVENAIKRFEASWKTN